MHRTFGGKPGDRDPLHQPYALPRAKFARRNSEPKYELPHPVCDGPDPARATGGSSVHQIAPRRN